MTTLINHMNHPTDQSDKSLHWLITGMTLTDQSHEPPHWSIAWTTPLINHMKHPTDQSHKLPHWSIRWITPLINHMYHPTDQSPKIPLIHFLITHSFLLPLCFSQQVRSSHGVGSKMKMSNRGDNNSITSDVNTRVDRSVLYSFIHIHPGIMYESLGEYLWMTNQARNKQKFKCLVMSSNILILWENWKRSYGYSSFFHQ